MGFYDDTPPRHGHRSPSELAEDELLAAAHGNVCVPGHLEETGPTGTESVRHTHVALLPWADAHPFTSPPAAPRRDTRQTSTAPIDAASSAKKPRGGSEP